MFKTQKEEIKGNPTFSQEILLKRREGTAGNSELHTEEYEGKNVSIFCVPRIKYFPHPKDESINDQIVLHDGNIIICVTQSYNYNIIIKYTVFL